MQGKIFVGYQGWHAPSIEGTNLKWMHFGDKGKFEPGFSCVDLWPDVSDLAEADRIATGFKHTDGRAAQVYSPASPTTVDKHFEWMKTYGIDGAFVQRFGVSVNDKRVSIHVARVLENVRKAADHHDRSYAIMYDLSGLHKGQLQSVVMTDWKRLVTEQKVRNDRTYLHHNGKPVVAVWGIGFNDNRDYTLAESLELIRFLKSDPIYGGNAVMIGVPFYWRTETRDTLKDPLVHQIIAEADIVSPWSVGRYNKPEAISKIQTEIYEPDLKWLAEHGTPSHRIDYLPAIFPGFSWHNLQSLHGKTAPFDAIPRKGGQFLWSQAAAAKNAGAQMLYVAMFDEIDEGTAIFKVTADPPAGFLALDVREPDHYLWLTGEIGKVLRETKKAPGEMPKRAK